MWDSGCYFLELQVALPSGRLLNSMLPVLASNVSIVKIRDNCGTSTTKRDIHELDAARTGFKRFYCQNPGQLQNDIFNQIPT
jgi:hypothetical protein